MSNTIKFNPGEARQGKLPSAEKPINLLNLNYPMNKAQINNRVKQIKKFLITASDKEIKNMISRDFKQEVVKIKQSDPRVINGQVNRENINQKLLNSIKCDQDGNYYLAETSNNGVLKKYYVSQTALDFYLRAGDELERAIEEKTSQLQKKPAAERTAEERQYLAEYDKKIKNNKEYQNILSENKKIRANLNLSKEQVKTRTEKYNNLFNIVKDTKTVVLEKTEPNSIKPENEQKKVPDKEKKGIIEETLTAKINKFPNWLQKGLKTIISWPEELFLNAEKSFVPKEFIKQAQKIFKYILPGKPSAANSDTKPSPENPAKINIYNFLYVQGNDLNKPTGPAALRDATDGSILPLGKNIESEPDNIKTKNNLLEITAYFYEVLSESLQKLPAAARQKIIKTLEDIAWRYLEKRTDDGKGVMRVLQQLVTQVQKNSGLDIAATKKELEKTVAEIINTVTGTADQMLFNSAVFFSDPLKMAVLITFFIAGIKEEKEIKVKERKTNSKASEEEEDNKKLIKPV